MRVVTPLNAHPGNQPRALLEAAFSAAMGLFARLTSDVAVAFLRRHPTQHTARTPTEARFATYLRRISYCGGKPVTELFARVHNTLTSGLTGTEADGCSVSIVAMVLRGGAIELAAE